ncbi:MAG: MptD family putative ECF transporter S component [Firmicutes bacterium]|nr:MptD family putative ECF transporter S component [Bacillota bacterium]
MKKTSWIGVIIAAILYCGLFVLASSCGLIHPACYAYAGTFIPLLFSFVYLYTAAQMQCFGAALVLNGFMLIVAVIAGEGNLPFVIGVIILTLIAEAVRKLNGYDTLKGVRRSFIPFAFAFYAYAAHWWTNTEGSLAEAVEEMPAGYADKMEVVIRNIRS